jgi:hypothetical protein
MTTPSVRPSIHSSVHLHDVINIQTCSWMWLCIHCHWNSRNARQWHEASDRRFLPLSIPQRPHNVSLPVALLLTSVRSDLLGSAFTCSHILKGPSPGVTAALLKHVLELHWRLLTPVNCVALMAPRKSLSCFVSGSENWPLTLRKKCILQVTDWLTD